MPSGREVLACREHFMQSQMLKGVRMKAKNRKSMHTNSQIMQAKIRKALAITIAAVMALSLIPPIALPEALPKALASQSWDVADFTVDATAITGLSPDGYTRLESDKDLVIPPISGVDTIAPHAFQGLELASLVLPSSISVIEQYAFADNNLASLDLSGLPNLTAIAPHAFRDNKLESVNLGQVSSVGENAFASNRLNVLIAPELSVIGSSAFANNMLTEVSLPKAASIAADSFIANGRVVAISSGGAAASSYSGGSGHIVNPLFITIYYQDAYGNTIKNSTIYGNDFTSDNLLLAGTSATIHAPDIPDYVAIAPTSQTVTASPGLILTFVYQSLLLDPIIEVTNKVVMTNASGTTINQAELLSWATARSGVDGTPATTLSVSPTSLTISDGQELPVTYTATDSYGNVSTRTIMVTGVLNPAQKYLDGTWQYQDFTYSGSTLTGLSSDGLAKYTAGCTITLPEFNPATGDYITHIASPASAAGDFANKNFVSIDFSRMKDLVVIENNAFRDVPAASINLGGLGSLRVIGDEAFRAALLTSIDLSGAPALQTIGAQAFYNAPFARLDLTGNPALLSIGAWAFYGATLTSLDLSGNPALETIGNGAFYRCPLRTLDLRNNHALKTIGGSAFNGAQLTVLELSNCFALETIGEYAFQNSPLVVLNLSNNPRLKLIDRYAFNGAQLTALDLSSCSALETIGTYAFTNAPLASLALNNNPGLVTIGDYAFQSAVLTALDLSSCTALQSIGIRAFNNSLITSLDFSKCTALKTIEERAFYSSKLTSLNLSNNPALEIIGSQAFIQAQLTSLDLTSCIALQRIDSYAFGQSRLETLEFGSKPALTIIDDGAFQGARGLRTLDLSGCTALKKIGWTTFATARLTSLDLSNCSALETIAGMAFSEAELTVLDLRDCTALKSIGNYSFGLCVLKELDFSGNPNLEEIWEHAFYNSEITTLDFSNNPELYAIGYGAFYRSPLTSLDLSKNAKLYWIDGAAFYSAQLTGVLDMSLAGTASPRGMYSIGREVFAKSSLDGIIIGKSSTFLSVTTLYDTFYFSTNTDNPALRIVNSNPAFPITVLDNSAGVRNCYGYLINPVLYTLRCVDGAGTLLHEEEVILEAPLNNYAITAPKLFGWQPQAGHETRQATYNDPLSPYPGLPTPGTIGNGGTITFTYTKVDQSFYDLYANYTLTQGFDGTNNTAPFANNSTMLTWVRLDVSNPTLNTTGWKIELRFDPEQFITNQNLTGTPTASSRPYVTPNAAFSVDYSKSRLGLVTITLNTNRNAGILEIPISWRANPNGEIPQGLQIPIQARLLNETGVIVELANDTWISGTYSPKPYLLVLASSDGKGGPTLSDRNGETAWAAIFEDDKTYIGDEIPQITYSYYVHTTSTTSEQSSGSFTLLRSIESFTITNELPSYTAIRAGVDYPNQIAVFDPAKNPGWVDNGDGTVSFSQSGLRTRTLTAAPVLILDFPDLKADQSILNHASFTCAPYNKGALESDTFAYDSINSIMTGMTHPTGPAGVFYFSIRMPHREPFASRKAFFYDTELERATEFVWTLGVRGQGLAAPGPGEFYSDIVFAAQDLDERMMIVGVNLDSWGPGTVKAFDSNKVLLFEAQGGKNERIEFPAAIQPNIARLEFSGSTSKQSSFFFPVEAKVLTKLRDPDNTTFADVTAPGGGGISFEMVGWMLSANLYESIPDPDDRYGTISVIKAPQHAIDYPDSIIMKNFEEVLGIKKTRTPVTSQHYGGNPVDYILSFDYYNGTQRVWTYGGPNVVESVDELPFNSMLTNVRIIDVLPPDFLFSHFTPSAELLAHSTGLSYRYVYAGYTDGTTVYDTLEIIADTLTPGMVPVLGRISGTSDPLAYGNIINEVYLGFDADPAISPGGSRTNNTANPLNQSGVPFDYDSFPVTAVKSIEAQKYIRSYNAADGWSGWNAEGLMTTDEIIQYRLRLRNNTDDACFDPVFIEVLPYAGDVSIVANASGERNSRGTTAENTLLTSGTAGGLSLAPSAPAGWTIEYLNLAGPIPASYGAGVTADAWFASQTWSSAPNANTRAIRFTAPAGTVLASGASVDCYVAMTQSSTDPGVKKAWNSFAVSFKSSAAGSVLPLMEVRPVFNGYPLTVTIQLTKQGQVSYPSSLMEPLAGCVFGLFDPSNTMVATAVSTSDAAYNVVFKLAVEQIAAYYTVRELSAPDGYFTVDPNKILTVLNADDFNFDASAGGWFWQGGSNIYQSGFIQNYRPAVYGSLKIKKLDANGQPMEGVTFSVYHPRNWTPTGHPMPDNDRSYVLVTDANGEAELPHVLVGTYDVTETSVIGSLIRPSFRVTVGANGNTLSNINPAAASTAITLQGDRVTVQVDNNLAQISVVKLGVFRPDAVAAPPSSLSLNDGITLANVQMRLYNHTTGAQIGGTFTTNAQGRITNLPVLSVNTVYRLQELSAPTGFQLDTQGVIFSIDDKGRILDEQGRVFVSNVLIYTNYPIPVDGRVSAKKTDSITGAALEGVPFEITRQNENTGRYEYFVTLYTDASGLASMTDIPYGAYRLRELPFAGYLTSPAVKYFTINATEPVQTVGPFEYANYPFDVQIVKGELVGVFSPGSPTLQSAIDDLISRGKSPQLVKNDDGTVTLLDGLGGAVFEMDVYHGQSISGSPDETVVLSSAADGVMALPAGYKFNDSYTYVLRETTAPSGYGLMAEPYVFRPGSETATIMRNGGKWIALINIASTHSIVVSKYAADTKQILPGVTFELLDTGGTQISTTGSDVNGMVRFSNLSAGIYYLKEIATVTDYQMSDRYLRFVLGNNVSVGPGYSDAIDNGSNTVLDARASEGDAYYVLYNNPEDFGEPDGGIIKTVENLTSNDGKTYAGDKLRYTISVTNTGTADWSPGTVADNVPATLSVDRSSIVVYAPASNLQGSGNSITVTVGAVPVSADPVRIVSFEVTVLPAATNTVVTNVATAGTGESGSVDVKVDDVINLSFEPNAGGQTVTNMPASVSGAEGSTINLPANVPLRQGYAFKGWSRDSSATLGSMQPSDPYTFPGADDTLYAIWEAIAIPGLFKDAANTTVRTSGKTYAGDTLVYTISVENTGAAAWSLTSITDTLPAGVTYQSHQILASSLVASASYDAASGTVVAVMNPVPANTARTAVLSITVTVDAEAADTTLVNVAVASSGQSDSTDTYTDADIRLSFDPNAGGATVTNMPTDLQGAEGSTINLPANVPARQGYDFKGWSRNSSATTGDMQPGDPYTFPGTDDTLYAIWEAIAIPGLFKDAENATTRLTGKSFTGDVLIYTISVENTGAAAWPLTTITDALPAGVTYISHEVLSSTLVIDCNFAAGVVTAEMNPVPANTPRTPVFRIMVRVKPEASDTTIVNIAIASTGHEDEARVFAENDIRLTFDPNAGTDTVTNMPNDMYGADGATVDLPENVPLRHGWEFKGWSRETTATSGDMQPGDAYTFSDADDTLYAIWEAIAIPGLFKDVTNSTRSTGKTYAGDTLVYTISVENDGAAAWSLASITDSLPVGVTYQSHEILDNTLVAGVNYDATTGIVLATMNNVPANTPPTPVLSITVIVKEGYAETTLINIAVASSGHEDTEETGVDKVPPPDVPIAPKTGDSTFWLMAITSIMFFILAVLSLGGFVYCSASGRRKNGER